MRALAFARALIARWDRRVVWPRPLGMVFRTPPVPASAPARLARSPHLLHTLRQSVHVDVRPAIALTLVRPLETRHATSIHQAGSAGPAAERTHVEQLALRNSSALIAERVLERALSRSRRVELLVRSAPGRAVPRSEAAPDLPPQLVVQRAPAPAAHEGPPRERDERPEWPAAARPPATRELDLGRLTDSVVSAIDGRLAVHAERLGRG